jgi:hypothetical protein
MAVSVINATGVSITGAGNTYTSVYFTVTFTNSSANNVQFWEIRAGDGTLLNNGTIPRGGSRTVNFNSGNVYQPGDTGSYSATRTSQIGNTFTAILGFAIEQPPPFFPPFFPFFPYFPFFPTFTPAPSFSDETASNGRINIVYSDGVSANNVTSYSVDSGALPAGLSLNTSTGAIVGTPTDMGDYSFVVKATGAGGSTLTGTISIKILPTGARITGASTKISLLNAKRFDGTNWQNLKTMKKFDGTNWQNISNE